MDCYRPFSFEFDRAGWFYVYGNTGAFLNSPSTEAKGSGVASKDLRKRMSLFKVKGAQRNEGEIYVFFNSWYYADGKGLFPKGKLGRLVHMNNAAGFGNPRQHWMFGNDGLLATELPYDIEQEQAAEDTRFTRRWNDYQIQFDGDIINDAFYPDEFRKMGYSIASNAKGADPEFAAVKNDIPFCKLDFTPGKESPLIGAAIAMTINLPGKRVFEQTAGVNVGAEQATDFFYDSLDHAFDIFCESDWIDGIPNEADLLYAGESPNKDPD